MKKNPERSAKQEIKKGERIAKAIAASGLCSRRDAEKWIAEGRVKVDGKLLTTPAFLVTDKNEILIDGKKLVKSDKIRLWRYHKPAGLIVTQKDPKNRPTVFASLPPALQRSLSVGRLDLNSEGLLLLTNSGDLARYMELPATGLQRFYRVRVHGAIPKTMAEQLKKGITVEGVRYAPVEMDIDKQGASNSWLYMRLTEGKNREIRKILSHFGLQVNRLIRVGYGPFEIGSLKLGQAEEIAEDALKKSLPGFFKSKK